MISSILSPQACLLFLSLIVELGSASCLDASVGDTVNQACQEVACGADPSTVGDGITVLGTAKSASGKRAVWDPVDRNNVTWPAEDYSYQVSPYFKPAAVLRECSGSIVTSFDTIHANLNGRGQTWVSQRNYSAPCCTNSTPIKLFSGGGAVSTVIKADIFFPGGVLHIVDKLLTTPTKLSITLRGLAPTAFQKLINAFIAYDNVPSSTFFIPSDAALAQSCSYTLAPGEARTLMNAQTVRDSVAYSPSLVDGAFFKAGNGEDITITVKADGTKYANGIRIVSQDIIVENGVVHIIDGLFSAPSTSCAGPDVKTVTVVSTIWQAGPTVTKASICPPAPTTTIYQVPGSCSPSTTTIFQSPGSCPAPSTTTTTLLPTTCINLPPTMSTTTFCPNPNPGTTCPGAGLVTTTTTLYPPGSVCPPPTTRITTTTSTTTTTYTTGGPPGVNITITSYSYTPGPTTYVTTTTTTCPPTAPASVVIPSGYSPEDCDANGVPYGPNNPNPRPLNSYIMSAIGGPPPLPSTSTYAAKVTPTVSLSLPYSAPLATTKW